MLDWKGVAGSAALAVLVTAGLARGDEGSWKSATVGSFERPVLLDEPASAPATTEAAPAARKPLMALLGLTPIGKGLDAANINLYGFVSGGYTYSASSPPNNFITPNVFNPNHERAKFDQFDFNIERTVDPAAAAKNHTFDIGGHIEFQYGYDTRFYHSNGLFTYYYKGATSAFASSPEDQMDLTQAYVDFAVPVGNGLNIRAGKFVTPLGAEVINATGNALYSHSYLFGYAIPFTHTGVLATYNVSDTLSVSGGATRGWNQSVNDNNGAADFLGGFTLAPTANDKIIVNVSMGPEAAKDNHDYWTVADLVITHKFSDTFNMTLNADYGDAPHALAPKSAQWGGVALYGQFVLCDYVTLNARGEWYDDYNGFTLGGGTSLNVYEATLGASITPMPHNDILKNLVIRPEVRGDYASVKFFDGGTDRYEFQLAVDAYFTF